MRHSHARLQVDNYVVPALRHVHHFPGPLEDFHGRRARPLGRPYSSVMLHEPVHRFKLGLAVASEGSFSRPRGATVFTYRFCVGGEHHPPLQPRHQRNPGRSVDGIDVHPSARAFGTDEDPAPRRSPPASGEGEEVRREERLPPMSLWGTVPIRNYPCGVTVELALVDSQGCVIPSSAHVLIELQ